ncbi:hypothetical protein LSH36_91g03041 [Paralvinella palmiformis]|uniref:EF-hand domain-containing protein n=1 Tax=Paralvinella palmiformis TaxID=53620 RepID=A0AAD9NA77_9ANNE|nr:hypothetical protein LSH36_91g03041 [Paralvinella palmiformis]
MSSPGAGRIREIWPCLGETHSTDTVSRSTYDEMAVREHSSGLRRSADIETYPPGVSFVVEVNKENKHILESCYQEQSDDEVESDIKEAFSAYDKDGDGYIGATSGLLCTK